MISKDIKPAGVRNDENNPNPNLVFEGINLARMFFEEGDDPIPNDEPVQQPDVIQVPFDEEDIDMGNLFGDDDDYWENQILASLCNNIYQINMWGQTLGK